jgi:RNA polymerase sigma factor (TIGR02999 family)
VLLMNEVTRILNAIEQGEPQAAAHLLPLVYDELRRLAAEKLAQEKPGQTLQATALVHEAYLRLVAGGEASASREQHWDGRRHFFAAAAEAMRRILIENARRKNRGKHGGGRQRVELDDSLLAIEGPVEDVPAVAEALDDLAGQDAQTAELVKLHYFAGLTLEEAAGLLRMAPRTAYRRWAYARAWLYRRLAGADSVPAE